MVPDSDAQYQNSSGHWDLASDSPAAIRQLLLAGVGGGIGPHRRDPARLARAGLVGQASGPVFGERSSTSAPAIAGAPPPVMLTLPPMSNPATTDETLAQMDRVLTERGYLKAGDSVVFLAGQPVGRPGTTNLMKLHRIGDA